MALIIMTGVWPFTNRYNGKQGIDLNTLLIAYSMAKLSECVCVCVCV